MADDGSQTPRIPQRLDSWQELNRRVATQSFDVLARLEQLETEMIDVLARIDALENP